MTEKRQAWARKGLFDPSRIPRAKSLIGRRPISRILSAPTRGAPCHLSSPGLATGVHLPTPPNFPEGKQGTQPCSFGVGVYMAFQPTRFIPTPHCCGAACALTARFHLYPERPGKSRFCDTICTRREARPHPLDGVARCVVRTFLMPATEVASPRQGSLRQDKGM